MYDLVIIGGGPAGVGAGVYAARKKLKTVLITDSFGGQSLVSADVQNWIGSKSLSGLDLAKILEEHLRAQGPDLEIWGNDLVDKVFKIEGGYQILTKKGKTVETKTILICSGSHRKRLNIPGEDRLDGKGVAWCSTCDAPLFGGKIVAVIGGGNAGLESVLDLNSYAEKIYLINRSEQLKGDPVTQEKIRASAKVEIIFNAQTQEILGEKFVSGLRYRVIPAQRPSEAFSEGGKAGIQVETGEEKTLEVQGVFVEIGSVPNNDFVKDLVQLNQLGEIIVDHKTQQTSQKSIWAAGDVSDVLYKQNNVSVGDAIKAVLNIYSYLH